MENLKQLRKRNGLTQQQAASLIGISLRSYKDYENDPKREGSFKYNAIIEAMKKAFPFDEEHGILKIEDIQRIVPDVLSKHDVDFCYLFGSYAKGKPSPQSDVDLLISTKVIGLAFFGLIEELREALGKKVDLLDMGQIGGNPELLREILKNGIRIYVRTEGCADDTPVKAV